MKDFWMKLPPANDPIAFPDSNWATSFKCDLCGKNDYELIDDKGIMTFYQNPKTYEIICELCKRGIDGKNL